MDAQVGSITINGIEYVEKSSLNTTPASSDVQIVILQRGWVMVGRFAQDGERCTLDNASVIRTWGTKKGLGQLAIEGPQSGTVLDKTGHVEFNELTMVARLATKESLWPTV